MNVAHVGAAALAAAISGWRIGRRVLGTVTHQGARHGRPG